MRNKYTLILIILFFSLHLKSYSQTVANKINEKDNISQEAIPIDVLDKAHYRVFYSISFVKDSTQQDIKTESQCLLLIGNRYSEFLDYYTLRKDSVYNSLVQQEGANSMAIIGQTISIGRQIQFKPIIIKNYPKKGEYTFQEMITSRDNYRYIDKGIQLDWALGTEEKVILDYTCNKATCTYRGRDYIAWYCPDIPIAEGPYIFGGLPGLIMEIYDTKQHYTFSINGFIQLKETEPIYLPSKGIINSSRKTVRKIISNLKSNPASILQMMGSDIEVSQEVLQKLQPKPYNPIELE